MRRLWLIAEREFLAYANTASFWLALLTGPVIVGVAALLLSAMAHSETAPRRLEVQTNDPALSQAAWASIRETANLEGWSVAPADGVGDSQSQILITRPQSDRLDVTFKGAPLSATATALLRRDLMLAATAQRLVARGVKPAALAEARAVDVAFNAPAPAAAADPRRVGRFALMMLLWVNLVGALGMLMQAIVRERVNRALESLLSAARPAEVVFGKLLGVGAVSMVVVAGWGAAAAATGAAVGGQGAGAVLAALFPILEGPWPLLQAGVVFVLAFVMYGSVLLGLGARARDVPSAQNLARPVFGALLLVFFSALAQLGAADGRLDWLIWAPPFTPFMLLLAPSDALGPLERCAAIALLAACAVAAAWLAPRGLAQPGAAFRRHSA
ncbi:MAG: ABC transporter permease [Phenylobacterium sp.]|uniref:ABC transporter permease n=1 Tax=Phenylobacterium sp. TaxID=1871053 RepID=UPI002732E8A5|nr:ABC transporter permease [Phenylobacterium sp.]MDP3173174.1 ABC transporter permease [Phenylobacterium sp.]